ncbi:MAG: hypothetical protein K0U84_23320 [Actinomycetia bacterium]|nr:hypothetical protein [Actinomycetes bacterium]
MRLQAKTKSGLIARVAAAASLGAALIHFATLPAHWQEWPPSGVFFALLAVFQFGWALAMALRPQIAVLTTGIVANLGAIALWVLSRTSGIPFGPHAGEAEAMRAAGVAAVLLEATVVIGAAYVWILGHKTAALSGMTYGIVLATAGAGVAVAVVIGVDSGLDHSTHAPNDTTEFDDHHHSPGVAPPDREITSPPTAPPPRPLEPTHHHDHEHG